MAKADERSTFTELQAALQTFAEARDWEQFHTPKNLSMALAGECAEVVEHFQWLTPEASAALSDDKRAAVALELADVFIYTLRLADVLDVDLLTATQSKMRINEQRYPAERVRGDARRADEWQTDD